MSRLLRNRCFANRLARFSACLALLGSLVSCSKTADTTSQQPQRTFSSPEDAGTAFLDAAKSGDQQVLLAIFGPDTKNVLFSGDPVKDKDALRDFVAAYTQMHRWREIQAGAEMLYIGADNFVFPVPLAKNASGQWQFDTAAGKDEILARRIGKDELTAIAACEAVARAENQYFSQARDGAKQYAQKLVSDDGKQNGLYWPVAPGQPPSPLEDVRDFARAAGYTNAGTKPQPFVGYYFRILRKGTTDYVVDGKMTGGFAIVAYPAEYRNSGIMTFIIGKDGVVYQKDLGEKTTDAAEALVAYDPSDGWRPASQ